MASSGANPQPVIPGSFNQDLIKVDKNSGALNTVFPLDIPPGRNNLQPDLKLTYSSQDGGFGNIIGEGWSINIPYIERFNKTGIDKFYSTSSPQYFTSSLDGELATTSVSSNYVPRTENGAFHKYVFSNNSWVMTDKDGTQYTFGSAASSEQNDPNNSSNVYRWMLTEVRDTNDNYISYAYFKDAGQIYPSSIVYTGNGSTDGIFEIDFLRTASADNATSSATGFPVRSNYRINEIDAKVNGSWVRKYALAFSVGDNGSTTLLSSITESGHDSQGNTITLPPTSFSYQSQTAGWNSSSTWVPPIALSIAGAPNGSFVVDLNGDGLPDLFYANYFYAGTWQTSYASYINNGHGWTDDSSWYSPIPLSNTGLNDVRVVDVNGDGLADLLYANYFYDGTWHTDYSTYINNGHGWTLDPSWNPPMALENSSQDNGVKIVDVNGDGLPDLLYANSFYDGAWEMSYAAYINNGHGWTNDPAWYSPVTLSANDSDIGVRVVDVNGDGLADLIYNDAVNGSLGAYINNGHGWTSDSSWIPPVALSSNSGPNGTQIIDANDDGLPDIVYSDTFYGTPYAYINNGHGWTSNSAWIPPINLTDHINQSTRLVDVNGDGLPDIISNDSSWGTSGAYANKNSIRADLSTNTTYPQGGSTAVQYKSAVQITDGSGTITNKIPYPIYVVSQITNNDGSQNAFSSTYQYASGTYYYAGPYDKQFAGFNLVAAADGAGNVTKTYYHTGAGSDLAHGEYQDNFWKIGKPYRTEAYDNAGHLYKKTINKWDSYALGGSAAFAKLVQVVESDYDGLSTHRDTAEAYTYDNTTGNQTETIQWGEVTGSDDGTFIDNGSDKYTTDSTYATSGDGVIGKPSDVTMTDQSGNKVKESRYYYDNLALGSATTGNLTKEEDWKTGTTYINTQNTYNAYGLVTQSLDPRGKQTTYSYDAYNLYPASVTNPLSQVTRYEYDYSTGKPTQTIDPNNDTFQTTYDGIGRPVQVLQPDTNTSSTLVTKATYTYVDTSNAVSTHESDFLDSGTTVDTYSYYDGLDRLLQTRKSAEDTGTYKVIDRAYNNVNLLQSESLPYFSSGSSKTAPTNTASLLVSDTYDPLQRILTTTNAAGTTSNLYANWKVTTTDPRGKQKDQYDDAFGNLVRVDEHNNGSTYSTYYTYDGLKDLTNITDALGNVRNFTYDGLGRRLTAQDLHAPGDATYGTWTYSYDAAGNLTQTVDPKSQTVNYTYDDINRPLTEDYTGQAGTEVTYSYDSCTQGVTRLCSVTSPGAVASYSYDGLGDVAQETKTISGNAYTTNYSYDRQGDQLTISNPDGSQVQYAYNTAGLPETVSYKPNGGSLTILVSNFDYSPEDQVALQVDGNGVSVKNVYDPSKLYRLMSKVTTDPANGGGQQGAMQAPFLGRSSSMIAMGASQQTSQSTTTVTKSYTGALDSYTVPAGVMSITITAYGAQGGTLGSFTGGKGGEVFGTIAVTPGETFYINIGGQNGYNGGGGISAQPSCFAAGGGMTWVSSTSTFNASAFLVAAGGGGAGCNSFNGDKNGGNGGGLTGSAGSGYGSGDSPGGGGTQTAGGPAGGGARNVGATAGSFGHGGNGGYTLVGGASDSAGGGGGGGYFGGGGGGTIPWPSVGGDGGGGGSSHLSNLLSATGTIAGVNTGNGYVTIVEQHVAPSITSFGQYRLDAVTPINEGSSTDQNGVVFNATLNSNATNSVQLQVEEEPAGTRFTNTANVPASAFVPPGGSVSTTLYGANGSYHWQARAVDTQNNASDWQLFGPNPTSTDFILKAPTIAFTTPPNGTTTPPFPNWTLVATNVTSTNSYQVQVAWGISQPNQMSNSVNASGSQLLSGINVPKTLYYGDYTDTGATVGMVASSSLYDITSGSQLEATTSVNFNEETISAFQNCGVEEVQCISYTYDNDGNITRIEDNSASGASKTVDYVYDDLNRLTSASSSNAISGQNYLETYSYDALGNMLSKSDTGTYTYGGGYADPDAVTSITNGSSTTNFAYDLNGNLLTSGNATNTWNYRNRLTQSVTPSGTSTYAYDYQDNRVKLVENGATTLFPTNFYDAMIGGDSTTTAHIFANDLLIGIVENSTTTSSTLRYALDEYLGGTNLMTDASGTVSETLDYYPYGAIRLDNQSNGVNEKRKYVGTEFDQGTGLNYMQARFQDPNRGEFLSEDPVFIALGNPVQLQQLGQSNEAALLTNPQSLNAYGYAEDNPITNKDPNGRYGEISGSLVLFGIGFSGGVQFDQNGIDIVGSAQAGYGFDVGLQAGWVPGVSLAHLPSESINAVTEGGAGVGVQLAKKIQSTPEHTDDSRDPLTVEPLIGNVGYSVGAQAQFSNPIFVWGTPPIVNEEQNVGAPGISSLPKTYISQGPVSSPGSVVGEGGGPISSVSIASLQHALNNISSLLAHLQSTSAVYQSTTQH